MLAWKTAPMGPTSPAREVEVCIAGTADLTTAHELHHHLVSLAADMVRDAASLVRFDMRDLTFMNSSCVKEVIAFVDELHARLGLTCRVQFIGDKRHAWQRRTLRVLHIMEPDLVTIELT